MTLLIAIVLVILVVYLFLQDWRATLIPLLAVPVSLVGTFVLFPLFGFSINTLSMFGLVLAIGLVVDDAIVVVEGVQRHIEEGLNPKDAARKAMDELSGPVIGIALVLSSVFVPTAFIPGITGRLYQQFAVTIAISVVLSAFNALTLSPALSGLLLRKKKESHGLLQRFFNWFNRLFERATGGYVHWSGVLLRKGAMVLVLLVACGAAGIFFGSRLPSSFLPDEDQGYLYINMQLPNAASLERTSAAARQVEQILADTPGVQYTTSVVGFSLLSYVRTSYNGFFWVSLKPWDERKSRAEQYQAIKARLNQELKNLPAGTVFSFSPPAIPGVGTSGGVSFVLEDRAGRDVPFLANNLAKFLAAARKRPEIGSIFTTFIPSVPQEFIQVDKEKVLKQGVALTDVYNTIQANMGGLFVNYYNQFGRTWQVYIESEAPYRSNTDNLGQFYVRNNQGETVPLSALASFETRSGPEFTMRYNEYRSAQINASAAPGYSSDQATAALEDVFKQTMPHEMGFDYLGMSYQEQKARRGRSVIGHLRILAALRLPDSCGALRKLESAVQRTAEHASRGLRSFWRAMAAPRGAGPLPAALHGPDGERCLCADRPGDADRPCRQERDSDRRVCQGAVRTRQAADGCGARRRAPSPAAHHDDLVRVHSRLRSALDRFRGRLGRAPDHGHHRDRRHDSRKRARHLHGPGNFLPGGAMVRGGPRALSGACNSAQCASTEGQQNA